MKKFLLLSIIFTSVSASAQEQATVSENLFSVSFLLPGIEYETALSNKTTLDFRAGTGLAVSGGMYRETEFGIFLNFHTQYRYYYNFERRQEKGKNTRHNSANYFALNGGLYSGEPVIGGLETAADYSGEIGPVWGIQRVYNSGFKLDLHLGAGYVFNDLGNSGFSPIIGFRLGWLISD